MGDTETVNLLRWEPGLVMAMGERLKEDQDTTIKHFGQFDWMPVFT